MSRACALGGPSCSSISAGSRRTIQFAYLQQDTGSYQDKLCSIHAIGNEGLYSPGITRYLKCEKLGPFQYLVPSTSSVGHVSESLSLNIVEEALDCHRINVLLVNVRTFRDELRPCGNNCLPKYCDLFILREPNLNIACGLRRSRASFRIYAGATTLVSQATQALYGEGLTASDSCLTLVSSMVFALVGSTLYCVIGHAARYTIVCNYHFLSSGRMCNRQVRHLGLLLIAASGSRRGGHRCWRRSARDRVRSWGLTRRARSSSDYK